MTEMPATQRDRIERGLMVEAMRYAYEQARDGNSDPIEAAERAYTYCLGTKYGKWIKSLTEILTKP